MNKILKTIKYKCCVNKCAHLYSGSRKFQRSGLSSKMLNSRKYHSTSFE